jgi:hypothetical protein
VGHSPLGLKMMRTFSAGIVWGIVMLALLLGSGCGKGGDGGNGTDDNAVGGPAGDDAIVAGRLRFVVDRKQYDCTTCIARPNPRKNITFIKGGGNEIGWALTLKFPGTATGQFDEDAGATCSFLKPPFGDYDSETVTIAVSAYGKDGGVVE